MEHTQIILWSIAALPILAGAVIFAAYRSLYPSAKRSMLDGLQATAISPRLEYCHDSGAIFYVIENVGNTIAWSVEVALPVCQSGGHFMKDGSARRLHAAMSRFGHLRYAKMAPGQKVETAVAQLPPNSETARLVYGLGIDLRMSWANAHGDRQSDRFILPVEARRPRGAWQEPVWGAAKMQYATA